MKDDFKIDEKLGIDELLDIVCSVNLYDKAKSLRDCIQDELDMVLGKINEYRKGGEVNIKIKFGTGDRNEINITADVTSKSPKGSIKTNMFYQDSRDGALYVDDPNQLKLIKVTNINEETHQKGAIID